MSKAQHKKLYTTKKVYFFFITFIHDLSRDLVSLSAEHFNFFAFAFQSSTSTRPVECAYAVINIVNSDDGDN